MRARSNKLLITELPLQRSYFQIKSHPEVLGVRTLPYLSGGGAGGKAGTHSSHNTELEQGIMGPYELFEQK